MSSGITAFRQQILQGIPPELPPAKPYEQAIHHAPADPAGIALEEANRMMAVEPERFKRGDPFREGALDQRCGEEQVGGRVSGAHSLR